MYSEALQIDKDAYDISDHNKKLSFSSKILAQPHTLGPKLGHKNRSLGPYREPVGTEISNLQEIMLSWTPNIDGILKDWKT